MLLKPYFYDEDVLLDRLSTGLNRSNSRGQEVVFLVGSPLSSPPEAGKPGVPGVEGVIDLIRGQFAHDATKLAALNQALAQAGPNAYQEAFLFLQGRRGQQAANEIVRAAVLRARRSGINEAGTDEACRALDRDFGGWAVGDGTTALGQLITTYPDLFGRSILTTNFDPLLEVAIQAAKGHYFRTSLHADGSFSQTEGNGCHVIHLHGYWYGSDTLNTIQQLNQPRPRLRASIASFLRSKLVVVCGYGGWDDAFTEALMEVVRDDTAYPEVVWTFYSEAALTDALRSRMAPGIDRGRVTLYSGIDCNRFFPKLYDRWLYGRPKPFVFISHAFKPPQRALVEHVHSLLKSRHVSLFEYQQVNSAGMDWREALKDSLEKTTHFVALLSPDYEQSPMCTYELEEILARGSAVSILPFLTAGRAAPHPKLAHLHNALLSDLDPVAGAEVVVQRVMAALDTALSRHAQAE
jgi:hypothetical protein